MSGVAVGTCAAGGHATATKSEIEWLPQIGDSYDAPVTDTRIDTGNDVQDRDVQSRDVRAGTARTFNLAVIGGDGIGPEVVAEGLKVLDAVAGPSVFAPTSYDLGASRWQRTGEVLPESVLDELAASDVIVFGAVGAAPGATDVPSGLLERFDNLPVDSIQMLKEGSGTAVTSDTRKPS